MSVAREDSPGSNDQPTMPLVSTGSANSCMVCGAHLASDQRYCVECGNRRGASRFQLAAPASAQYQAPAHHPQASGPLAGMGGRGPRMNSSIMLLGTVLIVLLAVGVGVLIGHNNSAPKQTKQPISVVINGGGSGSSSDTAASSSTQSTGATASSSNSNSSTTRKPSTKKSSGSSKAATKSASATNPNAVAKGKSGAAAAAKSFSSTATKKSTLGGSCSGTEAGCQNGKQSGNLFGG